MTNAQMVAEVERLANKVGSSGWDSLTAQEQEFYRAAAAQAMKNSADQSLAPADKPPSALPGWVLPVAILLPIAGVALYIATRP